MGRKTKTTLIIAILSALITSGVCLFLVYQINNQGNILEDKISQLNESNKKEESFISIKKIHQETESERLDLASKFLSSGLEATPYLTEIEKTARDMGLTINTKDFNDVLDTEGKSQAVRVTLDYGGEEQAVLAFTKMMENIRYHSYVNTLLLKKVSENNWQGTITILITVQ